MSAVVLTTRVVGATDASSDVRLEEIERHDGACDRDEFPIDDVLPCWLEEVRLVHS